MAVKVQQKEQSSFVLTRRINGEVSEAVLLSLALRDLYQAMTDARGECRQWVEYKQYKQKK